jgi:hypothetical protein
MNSQQALPLTGIDMSEELRLATHHLSAFLRSHLRLAKRGSPSAAVSEALIKHLKTLKPAELGLPEVWEDHAARIEAKAIEDAQSEGLAGHNAAERSA